MQTDVGKLDSASISDVIVESALSTIIDNEDSWLLMMKIKLNTIEISWGLVKVIN